MRAFVSNSLCPFTDYVIDAAYQGLAYYTMSCMTNSPFKLARMAGYYKGLQSAGSAVSSGMDAVMVCPQPRNYTKLPTNRFILDPLSH